MPSANSAAFLFIAINIGQRLSYNRGMRRVKVIDSMWQLKVTIVSRIRHKSDKVQCEQVRE